MEELDLVIDKETGYYNRSICRDRIVAAEMIQGLYKGSEKTLILSSGMNCIYLLLQTVLRQKSSSIVSDKEKKTVLISKEMYTDTKNKVLKKFKTEFKDKFNFVTFSYTQKNHFANLLRGYSKSLVCVFFEAVSNPSSFIVDFELLRNVSPECYVIVDNTWVTPLGLNPFDFNASCVVDSCSKYLSAGKCIAGHITFRSSNDSVMKEIDDTIRTMGIHVSPIHCRLIQKGINSLEENLHIISERTEIVVKSLVTNENVIEVRHPLLKTHSCHDLWKKYIFGRKELVLPGVVWFKIKVRQEFIKSKEWKRLLGETVKKHRMIYATSFGKPYSLMDMFPQKEKGNLWLRLSIGYGEIEKPEEIVESLKNILKDLN